MRVMNLGTKSATGVPTDVTHVHPFSAYVDERVAIFQAEFGGTATVALEGRLNPDCAYTVITSIVSSDATKAKTVALMPQMRINITAWTNGTVKGFIGI